MPHQPYLNVSDSPGIETGHATHAGRSGKNNEDLYALFETRYDPSADGFASQRVLVAVVADGIGGVAGGETASDIAIQAVAGSFGDTRRPAPQRLDEAIRRANAEIYRQAGENPHLAGMGTTVVAAIVGPEQFQVAHVGDSRAYLLRGGTLHMLTLDHSWAQEAIEAGRLTPEAARTHPNRHVIRRYLGGAPDVEVDYRMVPVASGNGAHAAARPADERATVLLHYAGAVERMDFLPGDTLLLCTDGLSDVVPEERIQSILARSAPQAAADKLIAEANKAGGPDNITAVVVRRSGGAALPAARRASLLVGAGLLAAFAAIAIVAYLLLGGGSGSGGSVAVVPTATGAPRDPVVAALAAPDTPTATPSETPAVTETATPSPAATVDVAGAISTSVAATLDARVEVSPAVTSTVALIAPPAVTSTLAPTGTYEGTPAASPTVTLAAQSTATRRPTSTPVNITRTATPSPSPTVTPRATPSATPRPRATQTAAPASTSTPVPPAPADGPVLPLAQGPRQLTAWKAGRGQDASYTTGDKDTFSWQTDAPLAAGQVFELVFIPQGGEPEAGRSTQAASSYSEVFVPLPGPGRYTWGVWLAQAEPYQRLRYLRDGGTIAVSDAGSPDGGKRTPAPPGEADAPKTPPPAP